MFSSFRRTVYPPLLIQISFSLCFNQLLQLGSKVSSLTVPKLVMVAASFQFPLQIGPFILFPRKPFILERNSTLTLCILQNRFYITKNHMFSPPSPTITLHYICSAILFVYLFHKLPLKTQKLFKYALSSDKYSYKAINALRARLGVAGHLFTTLRWGNPAKCPS